MTSRRVSGLLAVLAGVALPAACMDGEGGPAEEPAVAEVVEESGSTYELDCRRLDYPCTWGEVDSATLRRTSELGAGAMAVLEGTGELTDVAEWLREAAGVAEVQIGQLAVRFRPNGGRPGWILAPQDSANPRLGGAPSPVGRTRLAGSSGTRPQPARSNTEATTPRHLQQAQERNGVAAKNGEPGNPKRALILSPYEYEHAGKGKEIRDTLETVRDYSKEHGGTVTYHANNTEEFPNRDSDLRLDLNVEEVRLEDFRGWGEYNLVYLTTHGAEVCEETQTGGVLADAPATAAERCYTSLLAGQVFNGDPARAKAYDTIPGVDIRYTRGNLDPDLSDNEREECVRFLQDKDAPGIVEDADGRLVTTLGDPCFESWDTPWGEVVVSADFFRKEYEGGLDNILIFLAACESLRAGDLADIFTDGRTNENVAVFGYDAVIFTLRAVEIGREMASLLTRASIDSKALKRALETKFPDEPFTGVALGDGASDFIPARIVEAASNPTHARDVVELVDPLTGEELEDGAGIIALGSPNDGRPDRIRVGMQVLGIDDETDIDAIRVHLEVDGRETEPFALTRWVRPHVMRVEEEEVDLGFDLGTKETVDLEIHAELEGGGESRWAYDSLKLASWTMDLAAPSVSGRYAGFQGFFQDEEGEAQLSLCSNEGPHVWIIADVEGFAGPGQYTVTNPNPSASVAVGPIDFRTGDAAAMEAMNDFTSGNGTSVLHEPGGASFMLPPPATLQVTQATDEYVEGTLRGRFFQQRPPDYRYEEASVSISFRVRRMNPMESFFSIVSRGEEGLCVAMPF